MPNQQNIDIKKCHYGSNCHLSIGAPGSQQNRCLQNHQPVQPAKAKLPLSQGEEKSHEIILIHSVFPQEAQNVRAGDQFPYA